MTDRAGRRQSGLLIPLFSCPSSTSWGTGDIGDLVPLTSWLAGAGQKIVQLLPINERAPGQESPYSAMHGFDGGCSRMNEVAASVTNADPTSHTVAGKRSSKARVKLAA